VFLATLPMVNPLAPISIRDGIIFLVGDAGSVLSGPIRAVKVSLDILVDATEVIGL
jgi:hypothetical protein